MTISLTTTKKIPTYLFDRKQGQVYDTYYRAFEEYDDRVIGDILWTSIVNSAFVQLMTDDQLLAYGAFYFVAKPADMSLSDYRNFTLLLNNVIIDGPTINNVLRVLKFFDVAATMTLVGYDPMYNEDSRQEIDAGNLSSGVTTTSTFYDTTTHVMPTTEYIMLDEDSAYDQEPGEAPELTLRDENSVLYITSTLNIPDIGKRYLLRDALRKILPAAVRMILNFSPLIEVTMIDTSGLNRGVWSWNEDTEEVLYNDVKQNYNAVWRDLKPFSDKYYDAIASVTVGGSSKHTTMLLCEGTPTIVGCYQPDTTAGYYYMTTVGSKVIYWGNNVNPILIDPLDETGAYTTISVLQSSSTNGYGNIINIVPTSHNNKFWVISKCNNGTISGQNFAFSIFDTAGILERTGEVLVAPTQVNNMWQACVGDIKPVNGTRLTMIGSLNSINSSYNVIHVDLRLATSTNPVATVTYGIPFVAVGVIPNTASAFDIEELFVLASAGTTHIRTVSSTFTTQDFGAVTLTDGWSTKIHLVNDTLYIFNITQNKITRVDSVRTSPSVTTYTLPITPKLSCMLPVVSAEYTKLMV